jgi:hypothetical protein
LPTLKIPEVELFRVSLDQEKQKPGEEDGEGQRKRTQNSGLRRGKSAQTMPFRDRCLAPLFSLASGWISHIKIIFRLCSSGKDTLADAIALLYLDDLFFVAGRFRIPIPPLERSLKERQSGAVSGPAIRTA